ncbi:solute carrier family 22 member 23-like [Cyprinodon tularosa]|uniref:solute carrier family 22 member 23-like n=1 Tax=Cyprinodon tularosa TaxID=77115 RepID=UPI0018E20DA9|nr:solute carrier family 22 member 23-like [Cyprinodon tularosa]
MATMQLETGDHQPENGFVTTETSFPDVLNRFDRSVLPFLGGFGKYQKQLIVLTWIPALFIGFSQFSDNVLLAQPNSTCIQHLPNATGHTADHSSLLDSPINMSSPPAPLSAGGNDSGYNDSVHCSCCNCSEWTFELHTGLEQNVVTKWSLVCDSAWKVHIAKFSLLVGSIFGYLVFGILSDWFGRHLVLIISVLFMLVFGLTVAFSVNVPMFSTLRFFEGFCLAGISLSLYVLRIELCMPRWRFSMTMVASFVVLGGQLLMPGVAYLCRDWQVLQAVIICPLLLMLSYIWIFPESLRWLMATQQYSRSRWIMAHIAKKNKAITEIDHESILTKLGNSLQKKPKRTCIVKMAVTKRLWKNIVVLCVNSLTGYGIHHCFARSMVDPEAGESTMFHNFYADYYTMAGIAVASCIALCPAVGIMGRRGGLLMFMIITALASLLQLGLLKLLVKYDKHLNIDDQSGTLNKNFSIAFSIIGMFSSHAVSNLSIFFCAEITPTVIRGGGVGLVLASAGFGMLTAPIMELHNQKGYFLHHIIFACCTLICIICIPLLPNTRDGPLPETLLDGEDNAHQPLSNSQKQKEQDALLLRQGSNKDYAKVQDTPLHEAANAALSTMGSTASSAIDLTIAPGDFPNVKEQPEKLEIQEPSGHSSPFPLPAPTSAQGEDSIIQANKNRLLFSSPSDRTPCNTVPLLADAEELPAVQKSSDPPLDIIQLELIEMSSSPKSDDSPATAVSRHSSTAMISPTMPTASLISTTPVIEPRPSSTLESPNPQDDDIDDIIRTPEPLVFEESPGILEDLPSPSIHDSLPPPPVPSPVPQTDLDTPAQPLTAITTLSDISLHLEQIDESAFTPIRNSRPSPLDLPSSNVLNVPSNSSAPPCSDTVSTKHIHPPPTDSDHIPLADLSSVHTTTRNPALLPVTDIVNTSTPESTTNIVQDSAVSQDLDSAQSNSKLDLDPAEAAPVSLMDSTVSSPIDSGVQSSMDRETSSTENTVNSMAST